MCHGHALQEFHIGQRQASVKEFLLAEHLASMLSGIFELLQYRSPLTCAPYIAGGLLNPRWQCFDESKTVQDILLQCQQEWEMVLAMESQEETALLLSRLTPQCQWQAYRELLCTMEEASWTLSERVKAMVASWIPMVNSSANVEDAFNSMADAVARSSKTTTASLPNLQAVHVRACRQNMCGEAHQGRCVDLEAADWEGAEVRGLKAKLFAPTSYVGSNWTPEILHERRKPKMLIFPL